MGIWNERLHPRRRGRFAKKGSPFGNTHALRKREKSNNPFRAAGLMRADVGEHDSQPDDPDPRRRGPKRPEAKKR